MTADATAATSPDGGRLAPAPLADAIRRHLARWRGWDMAAALLAVLDEHQLLTYDQPPQPCDCSGDCFACSSFPLTMCSGCGWPDEECVTIQAAARALHVKTTANTIIGNVIDTVVQADTIPGSLHFGQS